MSTQRSAPIQSGFIHIRGARQNNLKGLNLDIPLNRITVITGLSGSGKSSLAFDTLYAEGQRRYVETFSPYARQFMERMDRPHVGDIQGIPPAIAIDRKDPVRTSRSTVGTMTEITDYVKLLYSRLGQLHCRRCKRPVLRESPEQVWARLSEYPPGSEILITFPFSGPGGDFSLQKELGRLGFTRLFSHGRITPLDALEKTKHPDKVQVIADRLMLRDQDRARIIDSLEQAFRFGRGKADVFVDSHRHLAFSTTLSCPHCGIRYRDPPPNLFSFNSPIGACDMCRGFGRIIDIDPDLIIADPRLSLQGGAVKPWGGRSKGRMEFEDLMAFCRREHIPTDVPFRRLKKTHKKAIFEGTPDYYGIRGFFRWLETKTYKMHVRVFLSRYRSYRVCPACRGTRFKEEALLYRLDGLDIAQVYALNVDDACGFFASFSCPEGDEAGRLLLDEVQSRLAYLRDVGLDYLTLDRQSRTLSGGEVQRVALASALGSSLVNTLYILDEPSIGLHPRDSHRLVRILKGLRDLQNTVVVVEHDPEIIRESDYMLDLGPGAGDQGGRVMYFGPTRAVKGCLTGDFLRGKRFLPLPKGRRSPRKGRWLIIKGAGEHNLKDIDVFVPLGLFVCLTGVSGSGKSTLAEDVLYRAVKWNKQDPQGRPGRHKGLKGLGAITDAVLVDQKPIGRTPRANPLTYTKAMDPLRTLLAQTEGARKRALKPTHFSFNTPQGRCGNCRGEGFEKVEMQFLSDVFVTCPECGGRRFENTVLEVTFQGKNIHQILSLTVDQALTFFEDHPKITAALEPLARVGLGYMRLGQPINTLSAGEAQRLKLSRYLETKGREKRLFILDEPTTGLHFEDISKLMALLQDLVIQGNSVLIIEHNMDVIKTADWVIDLGPEGGEKGGGIVATGPPEEVAQCPVSHTGRFLKVYLKGRGRLKSSRKTTGPEPDRPSPDAIIIKGAREHNLKNVALSIPRNQMVALTGVSGSGKSTLAFDILFAEGQRRYLESLAPYVRQYVRILERPEVDVVAGIPPAVAIEQRISHASRRSTVATLTEIYHFLRLLFSRVGIPHCPGCGRRLVTQTRATIAAHMKSRYGRRSALVLAPKVAGRKGFHKEILAGALGKGYKEARIDGVISPIKEGMALSRYHEHTIELVVAHLPVQDLQETVGQALAEGGGSLLVLDDHGDEEIFSLHGTCPACGSGLPALDPRLFSFNSPYGACPDCDGLGEVEDRGSLVVCPCCRGSRLRTEALSVTVKGFSIGDLVDYPAGRLARVLKDLSFNGTERAVVQPLLEEIQTRVSLLNRLGLSYLALSRSGATLSGGEAQRVRLAAQLGSNLTGICYVLDEPTIGLHARDNRMLLHALKALKRRGNSIVVVEHDEETIREADTIIDLGPGPGQEGGWVVAQGSLKDIKKAPRSVTGTCLNGRPREITSRLRRNIKGPVLRVRGASRHNLKKIDVEFPLLTLTVVTGVSGSGKSTLVKETLYRGLHDRILNQDGQAGFCKGMDGWKSVDRVLEVDHSPIGRTPRSVPASYVGCLSEIRRLLALTPEARARGYRPGRFSFNVASGRCETCKGHGSLKVAMSFLPDVYVRCGGCGGKRFDRETLSVTYKGKNVAQVLDLTFKEARGFFENIPALRRILTFVCDIGLGYLRLGQPSPTLSGGEAQRIKLAQELAKKAGGHTLYVLDEPTTGLHLADIDRLLCVLQGLVDKGNTVVVIEHNMEIIKEADHIIDLGPEGGDKGGRLVASGSPWEILDQAHHSHTAHHLQRYLKGLSVS